MIKVGSQKRLLMKKRTGKEMLAAWLLICWNEWCEEGRGGLIGEGGRQNLPSANSSVMSPNNSDVDQFKFWSIVQNMVVYLSSENIPEACGDQEVCWVHISSNVTHRSQGVWHLKTPVSFLAMYNVPCICYVLFGDIIVVLPQPFYFHVSALQ